VDERALRELGRAVEPRRVQHHREAAVARGDEPRAQREAGAAREPARELGEAVAEGEVEVGEAVRLGPGGGERALRELGGGGDRELVEVGEAVAELAGAGADVEGEADVGDEQVEDLEVEPVHDGHVRETHVCHPALEAQLEPRPGPLPGGGGWDGGGLRNLRHASGILAGYPALRELGAARARALDALSRAIERIG